MHIESLPNEFFTDFFGYLSTTHVFQAFRGLDVRFNFLFHNFRVSGFDFQATSQSNFDTICQIYISQTIDQLLPFVSMLTERAPGVVDRFLTHASLLNRFTYSQPLSVCNRRSGALAIQLIDDFQDLPNFMQLTVKPFFLLKELISLLVYLLAAFGALKSLNTATYRLNL
ncbi:unnamed protein product [Rotaria socialis]|uniref:Uncharacterized protein n=1 Tax=Rotaria socialis TaxID=392032 RepID=A0A817S4F3_9BILA|nr:unnamed protein product [Rotaria socialis]CAF3426703.1 unnamed protein product [Rotaria socialis]CAF3483915.1 unnamed protein product [Rotaria socialis]CAF3485271.1 unnamed protein product [Rotaria socialis]CAF3689747.1 unnamed protein product [Rotaria socialis]